MKKIILGLALVASTFAVNAQKFEGEVVMNYTYNEIPDEMAGMEAMLPQEMTITVKNNMSKINMPMGMGMKMSIISNSKSKKVSIFMDMMGQKIAFEKTATKEEEEKISKQNIKVTSETKTISGYKCTKAIITADGNETEVWFTKELPTLGSGSQIKGIKGFPMEYTVNTKGMNITISTSKITKKSVDSSTFKIPEGYEMKSEEDLKGLFGGM